MKKSIRSAKPFLKWAGGKTQILSELENRIPPLMKESKVINFYVEPFVGGGAFFFHLRSHYTLNNVVLLDSNPELIVTYKVLRDDPDFLMKFLKELASEHISKDDKSREINYYRIRDVYNQQATDFDYDHYNAQWPERAAYLIFLNKTCYNGLFRLNRKGAFNVPFGRYKEPRIYDAENLNAVNIALQGVNLICADFSEARKFIKDGSLVYLDPPYRPLNRTSNFTGYDGTNFDDEAQIRLADFFKNMDDLGAFLLLSNSDPTNFDPDDDFFEKLYQGFILERILARRNINSKTNQRGKIREILISNY